MTVLQTGWPDGWRMLLTGSTLGVAFNIRCGRSLHNPMVGMPRQSIARTSRCRSASAERTYSSRRLSERHERASVIVNTNLPFGEWGQVFQTERQAVAVLDRITHNAHILEMNRRGLGAAVVVRVPLEESAKKLRSLITARRLPPTGLTSLPGSGRGR